jgi:hypothetical protein
VTPALATETYTLTGAAGRISPPDASVVLYNVTRLRIWMRPADAAAPGNSPIVNINVFGMGYPDMVSESCMQHCLHGLRGRHSLTSHPQALVGAVGLLQSMHSRVPTLSTGYRILPQGA